MICPHRATALLLIALPLLLVACADDPAQPSTSGLNFPTNAQNIWVYNTVELDGNGLSTGDTLQDTARVVGTLERNGRTGTIIRMGAIRSDSSFTFDEYDQAPYAVESSKLYTIIDMLDSTSFYGTHWVLLADENGTAWNALDTTEVRASDSLVVRTTITGKRGGERSVVVKGSVLTGREYLLELTQVISKKGTVLSTYSGKAHYWLAPGIGIIAMREDPAPGNNGLDRVLIDYTIR